MNGKLNKSELKTEKELQLLGILLSRPDLAKQFFTKVPINLIGVNHRTIFEEISSLEFLDQHAIIHLLKKNKYTSIKEVLAASALSTSEGTLIQRIKEFYDISDSIEIEQHYEAQMQRIRSSLSGLDLLSETKNFTEAELAKYQRFVRELSFNQQLPEIVNYLERNTNAANAIQTTSFPTFNLYTGGLTLGNLVGIAGTYKNGKTTFALNLLMDFVQQKIPAALFSLEQSLTEIQLKIVAYKTGIRYERLRNSSLLNQDEKRKLLSLEANSKTNKEQLYIYDRLMRIDEIESKVRELSVRNGVKIFMVDYLGLVGTASKNKTSESREREVSQLSRNFKILAKETGTIILLLAQLNRTGMKEATATNLADSIALARDCDFLFTIQNPFSIDVKKIEVKGHLTALGQNDFLLRLDSSRHTQGAKSFLIQLNEYGRFIEKVV